ncbi:Uncharacterized protein FKW44_019225, partial [Caligus rogercresseyi]
LNSRDLSLISSTESTSITLNEDPSTKCVLEYRCPDCPQPKDLSFVPRFEDSCNQTTSRTASSNSGSEKERVCTEVCHGCPEFCDYEKLHWCEDEYKIASKIKESQACRGGQDRCDTKMRQRIKTDELSSKRACYEKVIGKVCAPLNCRLMDNEEDCYFSNST